MSANTNGNDFEKLALEGYATLKKVNASLEGRFNNLEDKFNKLNERVTLLETTNHGTQDLRIIKKISGNWVRPNIHFKDGSTFNTYNHRCFALGSVVNSWKQGDQVKIEQKDTWRGVDPYLLTNIRLNTCVYSHPW